MRAGNGPLPLIRGATIELRSGRAGQYVWLPVATIVRDGERSGSLS
jgi:hypothetical protein